MAGANRRGLSPDLLTTCGKQVNGHSDGLSNRVQYPSDLIVLAVLWRLPDKLSLRDLPGMCAQGCSARSRADLRGEALARPGNSVPPACRGSVAEGGTWTRSTSKMDGHQRYWCRGIDSAATLVDVLLRQHRHIAPAVRPFVPSARVVTGITHDRVTTDGWRVIITAERRSARMGSCSSWSKKPKEARTAMPSQVSLLDRHVTRFPGSLASAVSSRVGKVPYSQ